MSYELYVVRLGGLRQKFNFFSGTMSVNGIYWDPGPYFQISDFGHLSHERHAQFPHVGQILIILSTISLVSRGLLLVSIVLTDLLIGILIGTLIGQESALNDLILTAAAFEYRLKFIHFEVKVYYFLYVKYLSISMHF